LPRFPPGWRWSQGKAGSPEVVVPVCLLIIVGGIGFLTWEDIAENRLRFHRYRMLKIE
jgi:trk system potassium uptake protein TrkH